MSDNAGRVAVLFAMENSVYKHDYSLDQICER